VGTLAALGERGLEVQRLLFEELGLGIPEVAWHVARDRVAEVVCFLGLLASTLGKIAGEVALLSRTELGEVREPFVPGRGASSTMPQKRNPVGAEAVVAAAKVVRQQVPLALEAMVQDGERGTGPWLAEWECLPEAFILTAGALRQLGRVLAGLEVDAGRMARNLGLTGGLIMAEAVMMALAPRLGRQRAHELVYEACRRAEAEGLSLEEALASDPEVARHLGAGELQELLDPARYTGLAGAFVDRVVGLIRAEREALRE
jgi:3-carboxy-cis,cis-muconate cycloisomerase